MRPRTSERLAEQTREAQKQAPAAAAVLQLTETPAPAWLREDNVAAPVAVRSAGGRGLLRSPLLALAAGFVGKPDPVVLRRSPRTASPAALGGAGALVAASANGCIAGEALAANVRRLQGGSIAGKARAPNVRRLEADGLTVCSSATARQTVCPRAPARPARRNSSQQGRRVRVCKRQGKKWADWKEFQSLLDAANSLEVGKTAVHKNARGERQSPNFKAEFVDIVDDDLDDERWEVYTKGTKISDLGRVWNVGSGRKYFPTPQADGYCYVGNQRLHRIVAELFVPGRGARGRGGRRNQVDHIDGDRSNNAAVNLQWVTHKENMQLAAARREQQDVKLTRFLGTKDESDEEDEEWEPFVITQAMANLDARLRGHVRYDTGWQISNTGRVQDTRGYIKRPTPEPSGYRKVTINIEGEVGHFLVSRLVGWLFLGRRRTEKTQIDHIDKNKGNDRVGNLRWATPAQNRRNQG